MNWFEDTFGGTLKIAAWATILIALLNEVLYLHRSHTLYMALVVAALIYLALLEPMVTVPHIYFVKETGMFLYAKGSQRVAFDYLLLARADDNGGLFGGINHLHIAKPALSETDSHLVFDSNNNAVAILPHQRWYGTNPADAKVVLVGSDGRKTRMSIGDFTNHQGTLLHEAKTHAGKSATVETTPVAAAASKAPYHTPRPHSDGSGDWTLPQ